MSATGQLRPFDKFDTSQIQNAFPSYGKCRIVEIEKAPQPTHKTGRPKRLWQYSYRSYLNYGTGSTGRTFRYKKAFFSYEESATAKVRPLNMAQTRPHVGPARDPNPRPRIPLAKAPRRTPSKMSHCDISPDTKMSQMSQFQKSVTSPDTKKCHTFLVSGQLGKCHKCHNFQIRKKYFSYKPCDIVTFLHPLLLPRPFPPFLPPIQPCPSSSATPAHPHPPPLPKIAPLPQASAPASTRGCSP